MHEMFKIYEGKSGRIFNLRGLVSPSTYEIGLKKKKKGSCNLRLYILSRNRSFLISLLIDYFVLY